MSAPFQLLILDCDGVLVDSERIVAVIMAKLLADEGLRLPVGEIVARYIGHSGEAGRRLIERDLGHALPGRFFDALRQQTSEALATDLRPVDGVFEALAAIDVPTCVASNGSREKMDRSLAFTGLAGRFAGRTFSAADVARPKPAPDLLLYAARTLGAAPERCAVVDDTVVGIDAAVAAGMTVFGFAAENVGAPALARAGARVFDSMAALPHLIREGMPGGARRR
jgi:HAD superfamily hydrolase (TIGR01509 family)